jgi:hypothetical protein
VCQSHNILKTLYVRHQMRISFFAKIVGNIAQSDKYISNYDIQAETFLGLLKSYCNSYSDIKPLSVPTNFTN